MVGNSSWQENSFNRYGGGQWYNYGYDEGYGNHENYDHDGRYGYGDYNRRILKNNIQGNIHNITRNNYYNDYINRYNDIYVTDYKDRNGCFCYRKILIVPRKRKYVQRQYVGSNWG